MRKPIIAGNWKLNKTVSEAVKFVSELKEKVGGISDVDIIVCPPFTAVSKVADVLRGSNIRVGAQDAYWEEEGAFTGEISPLMVKEAGCSYVILGHSERRAMFGDTNNTVNKKLKAVLNAGLTPIVCVGEKLEEREKGITKDIVKDHIQGSLHGLKKEEMSEVVIAYEPVWAIGTGKTATPEQAQEVHAYIRELLADLFGGGVAESVRIQYGGSIKPDNIKNLMSQKDIDGGLVGGASLKVDSFEKLVKYREG
ncbi:MAG: triose-phosphate isomerase [Candidatus Aureabacteria bacterium]|nr:triose-phosphate isomerase [Candidatus Auribacterota bacterium]